LTTTGLAAVHRTISSPLAIVNGKKLLSCRNELTIASVNRLENNTCF